MFFMALTKCIMDDIYHRTRSTCQMDFKRKLSVTLLAKVYPNVTLRHQRARDKHMKIDEIRIYIPVRRA
jgi:hypothetical protein